MDFDTRLGTTIEFILKNKVFTINIGQPLLHLFQRIELYSKKAQIAVILWIHYDITMIQGTAALRFCIAQTTKLILKVSHSRQHTLSNSCNSTGGFILHNSFTIIQSAGNFPFSKCHLKHLDKCLT